MSEEFLASAEGRELTVRELLRVWGYTTRTPDNVRQIEEALASVGLAAEPGLAQAGSRVKIVKLGSEPEEEQQTPEEEAPAQVSLRVGDLVDESVELLSVQISASVQDAQTLMMRHDYSQLPVLDGNHLRGFVSWETIAASKVRGDESDLRSATNYHPPVVRAEDELLGKMEIIRFSGFAFVENGRRELIGIVTTADLASQFDQLASPFFMVGEVERRLRRMIELHCSLDEIKTLANQSASKVHGVHDLNFGDCEKILNNPEIWQRLKWNINHDYFCQDVKAVRLIRNAIMHFRPEYPTPEQRRNLQIFTQWLRKLDPTL